MTLRPLSRRAFPIPLSAPQKQQWGGWYRARRRHPQMLMRDPRHRLKRWPKGGVRGWR